MLMHQRIDPRISQLRQILPILEKRSTKCQWDLNHKVCPLKTPITFSLSLCSRDCPSSGAYNRCGRSWWWCAASSDLGGSSLFCFLDPLDCLHLSSASRSAGGGGGVCLGAGQLVRPASSTAAAACKQAGGVHGAATLLSHPNLTRRQTPRLLPTTS